MKNLYHKNKGKVYPSPSSSSSQNEDAFSVFKLLPVAILALASLLSLEDREVLAYLLTRSMKTTYPSSMIDEEKKNNKKSKDTHHKSPIFECGCFDCYTNYWFKWDSSPNRELIHQAIEAFEEHLTNGELISNKNGKGGKKKDKMGRRVNGKTFNKQEKIAENQKNNRSNATAFQVESPEKMMDCDDIPSVVSDKSDGMFEKDEICEMGNGFSGEIKQRVEENEKFPANEHRGLVRKILPDVMGIFNSRLWNLWNPNV